MLVAHTTKEWAKRNAQRGGRDERLLKEVATHVQKLIGLQGLEMGCNWTIFGANDGNISYSSFRFFSFISKTYELKSHAEI